MSQSPLFPLPEADVPLPSSPTSPEHARVVRPNRQQQQWTPRDLDAALAQDHPARAIWDMLERLDLSAFYGSVRAFLDGPGRPATDPQVLLALWLLATTEGIGSARHLARLCDEHDAYRWLCGGVPIPTGRRQLPHARRLPRRAAGGVGCAPHAAHRLADGGRCRDPRTRRAGRHARAREQVARLALERTHPDPGVTTRQQAARERAAREREARVAAALACLPRMEDTKEAQKRIYAKTKRAGVTDARVSVTDPDARMMKMPDGGFRLAYNVQFATDGAHGVIVGVAVSNAGTDAGQAVPVVDQVERRTQVRPETYLMDGGFATRDDITEIASRGITVYAPVRLPRNKPEVERYATRWGDSPEVAAWRVRMATPEAKVAYRQRGAIAEWTNAQVRQHGVSRFSVRGLANVATSMLLVAVAHNLLRWRSLDS